MTKPVPPSPMPAEASARTWPLAAAPALYWAAIAATGDLRPGIFAVAAGAAAAWLAAGRVRTLLLLIYPAVAALLIYDALRYLRPYFHAEGRALACELRAIDLALLPAGPDTTWPDVFARHNAPWADLLFAAPYAAFVYVAAALGVMLWFRDRRRVQVLVWAIALMYVLAMLIWIVQPTAPPWYVRTYGCAIDPAAAPSAAALARVDALLGISYFGQWYGGNPNSFGALPSLHNGFAMLGLLVMWSIAGWKERLAHVGYAGWMLVASVYLDHHWVIDGLAGWLCAAAAFAAARAIDARWAAGVTPDPTAHV